MKSLRAVLVFLALLAPLAAENPIVTVDTTLGRFSIELYPDKAPETVENFLQYVEAGHYNGTIFHRVIPNFIAQGGGLTPKLKEKPVRAPIANEADNGLKNVRGAVAMARTGDPHSATAQFYINVANNEPLDHKGKTTPRNWGYAVFGQVVSGMDVVDSIATAPTTPRAGHRFLPVMPVVIKKVWLQK